MMYAALPAVLGLSLLVSGSASAMTMGLGGGAHMMLWSQSSEDAATQMQTRFESTAKILGIGVDEVKTAWGQGKSMGELAKDKGITEAQIRTRVLEQQRTQMKAQLQTMVTKGIITQAQADARLKFMEAQWAKMDANATVKANKKGKNELRAGEKSLRGMHF